MNGLKVFLLVLALAAACSPDPNPLPPGCAIGRSYRCSCLSGAPGHMQCVSSPTEPSGTLLTECGPCATTATDPCESATSCETCTPLTGCGWCTAVGRCVAVNASCTGPAAGLCGYGWACQVTDCKGSTDCRSCRTNADCVSGQCLPRACDGVKACVPLGRPGNCATIGGEACPAVAAYHRCLADLECGPHMHCNVVWPGRTERVCTPECTLGTDCPQPFSASGVSAAVCINTGTGTCSLTCSTAGLCDAELTCRRDTTGNYAFCL